MRNLIILLLLLTLTQIMYASSCGDKAKSMIGTSIDNVVRKNGPPDSIYTFASGEKMYSWTKVGGTVIIGLGDGDAIAKRKKCKSTYIATSSGTITSCTFEGHCRCN